MKYSQQAIDKISAVLKDPNVKVVDGNLENALLDVFAAGKPVPKTWKRADFSPTGLYKDALDVLAFVHAKDSWAMTFDKESMMYEVYVVDKKYSVAGGTLARAIMLAMWNYEVQKNAVENLIS